VRTAQPSNSPQGLILEHITSPGEDVPAENRENSFAFGSKHLSFSSASSGQEVSRGGTARLRRLQGWQRSGKKQSSLQKRLHEQQQRQQHNNNRDQQQRLARSEVLWDAAPTLATLFSPVSVTS
jgi:hypothetical protein